MEVYQLKEHQLYIYRNNRIDIDIIDFPNMILYEDIDKYPYKCNRRKIKIYYNDGTSVILWCQMSEFRKAYIQYLLWNK